MRRADPAAAAGHDGEALLESTRWLRHVRSPRVSWGFPATTGRRDPSRARAHGAPHDLRAPGLRERRHEQHPLGRESLCRAPLRACYRISRARSSSPRAARRDDAEDPRDLALHLVRHADRRGLGHRRVRDRRRLELGRADPLARDVERVVGAPVQEPEAVLVDRRLVALRQTPGSGSRSRGGDRGRARAARHPQATGGETSSPTSPRTVAGPRCRRRPSPCRSGPPSEHGLVGPAGVSDRKHAPTSVPPEMLMIGRGRRALVRAASCTATDSRARRSWRSRSATEVGDERLRFGISARMSVGETPSIVTRSGLDDPQTRSGRPVGRALRRRRSLRPSAPAPTTAHRTHDPAHVGDEVDDVAGVRIAW